MDLKISKEQLQKALARVQGIVETRTSAMPILQNFLLQVPQKKKEGKVVVSATDLDISFQGTYEAEILSPGQITLPARKVFDIVKELPSAEVSLKLEENQWLRLTCAKSVFRFPGLPAEDFPAVPSLQEGSTFDLKVQDLAEMLRKTMFAISTDETRHALNGVFLEGEKKRLSLVATDGHRLAFISRACESIQEPVGFIVHRKAVAELLKLLSEVKDSVRVQVQENHVLFALGSLLIVSRLIEGQFPNYRQVIPSQNERKVSLSRAALWGGLRRVSQMADERSRMVKFKLEPKTLSLLTDARELGEAHETLEVDYEGEEVTVGFNARYVLDFLNAIETESVQVALNDPLSPGLFRPDGTEGQEKPPSGKGKKKKAPSQEEYLCVIMPMRV
jgi:DNA polymerase-3 subunit beta